METKIGPLGCEICTCGRCGGSGSYSFNLMHGSKCYGCGGTGWKLTKRGAVAYKYLQTLKQKPAKDVQVGDLLQFDMFFFKCFSKVTSVERCESGRINISGVRAKTGESMCLGLFRDSMVTLGRDAETKARHKQMVIDFQNTLTVAGTVRKDMVMLSDSEVLSAAEFYGK